MNISITEVKTAPQEITIRASEYYELKRKANAYDTHNAHSSAHMKAFNDSMSKEERQAHARKAAAARWHKEA